MRDRFLQIYRSRGVVDGDRALALHERCGNAVQCWKGHESRQPTGDAAAISLPWIGASYGASRIAVVGEDLVEDGGLERLGALVEGAKQELPARMKVRFGNEPGRYKPSYLWHHVGAYVATILRARGVEPFTAGDWKKDGVPRPMVVDAWSHVAFLNHVKCSPVGDLSRPSGTMWDLCGTHFLEGEIGILAPATVVALGRGENGPRLRAKAFGGWTERQAFGGTHVDRHVLSSGDCSVDVFTVPHSSARRVNWRGACAEVEAAIRT